MSKPISETSMRVKGGKSRWEKWTPEERRAHIMKMVAARKKK